MKVELICLSLILVISTRDRFEYTLLSYFDDETGSPVTGMEYYGSPLTNCSFDFMSLVQQGDESPQVQVRI